MEPLTKQRCSTHTSQTHLTTQPPHHAQGDSDVGPSDCGTPEYMAPEVLSSNVTDVLATDIWAVGITLYVMLAGFLPWQEVSTLRQPSFPPSLSPSPQDALLNGTTTD